MHHAIPRFCVGLEFYLGPSCCEKLANRTIQSEPRSAFPRSMLHTCWLRSQQCWVGQGLQSMSSTERGIDSAGQIKIPPDCQQNHNRILPSSWLPTQNPCLLVGTHNAGWYSSSEVPLPIGFASIHTIPSCGQYVGRTTISHLV